MANKVRITSLAYFEPESGPHLAAMYSVYDESGALISQNNRWNKALFDSEIIHTFQNAREDIKAMIAQELNNE